MYFPTTKAPKGVKTRIRVPITPERAKQLYDNRAPNRGINKGHLEHLTAQVRLNLFQYNKQPIVVASTGQMIDGQCRCLAVMETGVTIFCDVVIGMDASLMLTYNMGKNNTLRDQRKITGQSHSDGATGALNMVVELTVGRMVMRDYKVQDRWLVIFGPGIQFAESAFTKSTGMCLAAIKGAFALAYNTDPDKVVEFGSMVASGENLRRGGIAILLRNFLNKLPKGRAGSAVRKEVSHKVLRAIKAYCEGEKLKSLCVSKGTLEYFMRTLDVKAIEQLSNMSVVGNE